MLVECMLAAERDDPLWYMELARTATHRTAASTMSEWMVEMLPDGAVTIPGQHRLSPYAWRIAPVSVLHGLKVSTDWITEWGFWRTAAQYLTYVQGEKKDDRRPPYGRPVFVAQLFDFAFEQQAGRPFDFAFGATEVNRRTESTGLAARGQPLLMLTAASPRRRLAAVAARHSGRHR
jgi:hypothetical protein